MTESRISRRENGVTTKQPTTQRKKMKVIIEVMNTTWAVLKIKPEKHSALWGTGINFLGGLYFHYCLSRFDNCGDHQHLRSLIRSSNIGFPCIHSHLRQRNSYTYGFVTDSFNYRRNTFLYLMDRFIYNSARLGNVVRLWVFDNEVGKVESQPRNCKHRFILWIDFPPTLPDFTLSKLREFGLKEDTQR